MTRSEMDRLNRLAAALRRSLSARISVHRARTDVPADGSVAGGPGALLLLLCASPATGHTTIPVSAAAGVRLHILISPPAVPHTLIDCCVTPATKTARMGQVDRERKHRIKPEWAIYVDVTHTPENDGKSAFGGLGFGFVGGAVLGDLASASFQGRYSYSDRAPRISQTEAIFGGSSTLRP